MNYDPSEYNYCPEYPPKQEKKKHPRDPMSLRLARRWSRLSRLDRENILFAVLFLLVVGAVSAALVFAVRHCRHERDEHCAYRCLPPSAGTATRT